MASQPLQNDATDGAPVAPVPHRYRTFAGTIASGMDVIDGQDRVIGQVARVENDHIVLMSPGGDAESYFVPLSLIDGIFENQVLLARRGDTSFGMDAHG